MKQFNGAAANIEKQVVGLLTRNPLSLSRGDKILVSVEPPLLGKGFAGLITDNGGKRDTRIPQVKVADGILSELADGDFVALDPDGTVSVLWDSQAPTNALLLTEACDCHCIMCPQPPERHDGWLVEKSRRIVDMVKIGKDQCLCLTGGEPTLLADDFFDLLRRIARRHPKASVTMLTNGKSFADFEFTKRFVETRPKDFLTCVSLHGDVDELHDRIVGVKGSFYRTAMGLQNLARFRERIEIRVVASRMNADRLESIATFITRNFPFIQHCAFMGMEVTGLAQKNYEAVWIDPQEYRLQLSKAAAVLNRADMDVSVYNIPLCLLERRSWGFARKSISGWKNDYLPVCGTCSEKERCCGVFTTSGLHQSAYIRPFPEPNAGAAQ